MEAEAIRGTAGEAEAVSKEETREERTAQAQAVIHSMLESQFQQQTAEIQGMDLSEFRFSPLIAHAMRN
jgi:hypothetical protein